jgi:hypothetical protein
VAAVVVEAAAEVECRAEVEAAAEAATAVVAARDVAVAEEGGRSHAVDTQVAAPIVVVDRVDRPDTPPRSVDPAVPPIAAWQIVHRVAATGLKSVRDPAAQVAIDRRLARALAGLAAIGRKSVRDPAGRVGIGHRLGAGLKATDRKSDLAVPAAIDRRLVRVQVVLAAIARASEVEIRLRIDPTSAGTPVAIVRESAMEPAGETGLAIDRTFHYQDWPQRAAHSLGLVWPTAAAVFRIAAVHCRIGWEIAKAIAATGRTIVRPIEAIVRATGATGATNARAIAATVKTTGKRIVVTDREIDRTIAVTGRKIGKKIEAIGRMIAAIVAMNVEMTSPIVGMNGATIGRMPPATAGTTGKTIGTITTGTTMTGIMGIGTKAGGTICGTIIPSPRPWA